MYDTTAVSDEIKAKLPEPQGYRLLIMPLKVEKKTKGGLLIPDPLKDREGTASIIGFVVAMGADAYSDKDRFPNGPWCKEGDFVMFRAYSGTRFKVLDNEFRIINDDTVEAVVDDPREYERAF